MVPTWWRLGDGCRPATSRAFPRRSSASTRSHRHSRSHRPGGAHRQGDGRGRRLRVAAVEYRFAGETEWRPVTGTILVGLEEIGIELRATDAAGNVSAVEERTVPASDGNHRRNVALLATPTASVTAGWNRVTGLNDDVQPTSSDDVTPNDNVNVWGAWPEIGEQWVQYDWAEPVTIGELGVYFISNLDDAGLGIDVPRTWSAEYWDAAAGDAGEWVPVAASGAYGSEVDVYNVVEFTPVTTTRLRLQLEAAGTESGAGSLGIKEWQVYEAPPVEVPDTEAPVVTPAIEPATPVSGWHTDTVTASATALDNRDAAPAIEVQVGDGEWTAYTGPVQLAGDGVHVVRFRATDAAGNVSEPVAVDVLVDGTAPEVSVSAGAKKKVVVEASDALSGVVRIEVSTRKNKGSASEWTEYAGPIELDAKTVLSVRAVDAAGNVSEVREFTRKDLG